MRDLAALEAGVRRDLALISYPELRWLPAVRGPQGERVLDVLIVGGGQGGQALSFKLKLERIDNHLVIDRGPAGAEGPWRTFGRMRTLRTWKTVTGPDLGIPSLTYQSWFEAQHGAEAFELLNKIARESWSDYLHWLRRVLALPVEVGTELLGVEPLEIERGDALLRARVRDQAGERTIVARHVVLAHGIEASGRWSMPGFVERLPSTLRAHAADAIDFGALRGRRVAVLGAGASAFDNAATALEAGAEVHLFCRRSELQRVQPYKWLSFPAFFRHFADLDDAMRWKVMNYVLSLREALPVETWNRVTAHAAFELHTGAPWLDARSDGASAVVTTPQGEHRVDFLICGTGFDVDLGLRPELASIAPHIRTWPRRLHAARRAAQRAPRALPFPRAELRTAGAHAGRRAVAFPHPAVQLRCDDEFRSQRLVDQRHEVRRAEVGRRIDARSVPRRSRTVVAGAPGLRHAGIPDAARPRPLAPGRIGGQDEARRASGRPEAPASV